MGMNMVAHSQFPPNASYADKTVRRLSSLGFTALRLHGGDGAVSKGGMVQRNTQTGRGELNETLARRFDTLLAACRRHGLYVEISLSAINPFYATSALEIRRGQVPSHHKGGQPVPPRAYPRDRGIHRRAAAPRQHRHECAAGG